MKIAFTSVQAVKGRKTLVRLFPSSRAELGRNEEDLIPT
jgi:hypothetical protein